MDKKLPVAVGITDYKEISSSSYYVDKTLLIKELLDEKAKAVLFTRPRRFGKTLNMDMLRTFFEKTTEDTSIYFKNKKIWQQGEEYTKYQAKYPVIYISLKDINAEDWETSLALLKKIIRREFSRHEELLESQKLTIADADNYKKILTNKADNADYMLSLRDLSEMLHKHYGEAPVIIIDEYDTPIQEGYISGYYDKAVKFMRSFFSAALKDNPHAKLTVMTGILRIAKESIFSGLNNLRVYSVLDRKFSEYFGFTAEEVISMASYYSKTDKINELKEWYDGYKFGSTEIFNPWSVTNYFSNDCQAIPYWGLTSANLIVQEILKTYNANTYKNLQNLLNGALVRSIVKTNVIYPQLKEPQTDILGFLLMTGYLKSVHIQISSNGDYVCDLSVPNKEIRTIYNNEVLSLLTEKIGENTVNDLAEALVARNVEKLKTALNTFMLKTISYFDNLQENYYHGLMLGLIATCEEKYFINSNRESGNGRYDIQLEPKEAVLPGIIIEIKAASNASDKKLQTLAQSALEQIEKQKYDAALRTRGVTDIIKYGVSFCAKKVEIVMK